MQIGKFHQNTEFFWLFYPLKETAQQAILRGAPEYTRFAQAAVHYSKHFSDRLQCNVSFIEPKNMFVLLVQDGEFLKILTKEGNVGHIYVPSWCMDSIEEVNQCA
jgi:hypothetical protein